MATVHQLETGSTRHYRKWLVALRVGLGLCLFIKAIQFIYNSNTLSDIFASSAFLQRFSWLGDAIPYIHLLGGTLILAGLFTRFACIIQIPILLGAIIFVNIHQGFLSGGADLPFSIIILLFLIFFFVEGAGFFSLDRRYFSGRVVSEPQ